MIFSTGSLPTNGPGNLESQVRPDQDGILHTVCQVCQSTEVEAFCTAVDRVRMLREPVWRIERCGKCGFGWTSPALPEEKIASFYPAAYLGDTVRALNDFFSGVLARSRSWRGEMEKARLVESRLDRGRILDVGCGDGKFLWALDARKWDRTGVELSGETVALVRSRMPSLELIEGGLFSGELSGRGYDVLTFWHVFEHLPHPARNLRRASELLRPGGWLFISLPRFDSLQARLFRRHWYPFDDVPRHLYHFSLYSLDRLLAAAGFQVKQHLFFSRRVSFHSLKHSLLNWSQDRFGSKLPYYLLKPLLLPAPVLEQITGSYAILTTIARKPPE